MVLSFELSEKFNLMSNYGGELVAMYKGIAQNDVGMRTDVPKEI